MTMVYRIESDAGPTRESVADAIRTGRLLVGAMLVGTLVFALVVAVLSATSRPVLGTGSPVGPVLGGVASVLLVFGVVAGWMMAGRLSAEARDGRPPISGRLLGLVITRAALVEGPALMGAVTALLCGPVYLLITAGGAGLLAALWVTLPGSLRDLAGEEYPTPRRS